VDNTSTSRSTAKAPAWFQVPADSAAGIRLFCFPYAGGGSSIFRPWAREFGRYIEVVPALLPGREFRLREPAYTRIEQLVEALAREISPYLDKPFAFFGHSMGAIISFELARRLRSERSVQPRHLFISGRRSPRVPRRDPYIHDLPDAEFVAEIEQLNGTPREILEHKELMDILLPMLRADFAVCYSYTYVPGEPLRCPITVLSGTRDETTPREDVEGWRDETTGDCRIHMLEGDHFFINQQHATILPIIERALHVGMQLH
jgi:medium-chain acyl-[acyl-carrier-protein] hydrolase